MTYLVKITETLEKVISIEAENEEAAIEAAEQQYYHGEVKLGAADFKEAEFEITV